MYYNNINNTEVQQFHNTVKLTAGYNELEDYTNLFDTSKDNRLIPLFHRDTVSGNENLRIINNDVVIYMDDEDLESVYFSSENVKPSWGLLHEIITVNDKPYLKLHFYDKTSLFNLNNFTFHITQTDDGINEDYTTNLYGECIIKLTTDTGSFTVTSNNASITF